MYALVSYHHVDLSLARMTTLPKASIHIISDIAVLELMSLMCVNMEICKHFMLGIYRVVAYASFGTNSTDALDRFS